VLDYWCASLQPTFLRILPAFVEGKLTFGALGGEIDGNVGLSMHAL
jgi:hypothetical protein